MTDPQDPRLASTPASGSVPPPTDAPLVVRVEAPIAKVTLWALFICGVVAGIFAIGFFFSSITNRSGVITTAHDEKDGTVVKANLQDVSSVFTYHLTAIGIIVGLASVAAISIQILFQMLEARRNQQIRGQEEKRAQNMDQVIAHTGSLIKNMALLTETTERSMKYVNEFNEKMRDEDARRQTSLAELIRVSKDGLASISITKSSFPKDIQSVFTLARTSAHGISRADQPAEFLILDALYQGGHAGNSHAALDMLLKIDEKRLSTLDDQVRARYHYFCGHFALRVGKFAEAVQHFGSGKELTTHQTAYQLFATIAKLFDLRQNATAKRFSHDDILKDLERIWNSRKTLSSRDRLGGMDPKVFWEQLGHTYAAALVEGVSPRGSHPTDPEARRRLVNEVSRGRMVAIEANQEYCKLAGSNNGALDAALYEAGLILWALGDPRGVMTEAELKAAILGCGIKLETSDVREKIVFATRHARFHGRLAAAYKQSGNQSKADSQEKEMEESKERVLGLVASFKDEWVSGERLYSVFTNGYELPASLEDDIRKDISVSNYVQRLKEANDAYNANPTDSSATDPAPADST